MTAIDYSKTIIYKIVCNDLNITDLYIGSTTQFTTRKSQHKCRCNNLEDKNSKFKIYKTIRDNGGWLNWAMVKIEDFPCADGNEARARERYWYEQLNSNLNMRYPIRNDKEYREDNKELLKVKHKQYHEENIEKIKEQRKQYREANKQKIKEQKSISYQKHKDTIQQKNKIWRESNEEKCKEYSKEYKNTNREKYKEYSKKWRELNNDTIKEKKKEYYEKNKERLKAKAKAYHEAKKNIMV